MNAKQIIIALITAGALVAGIASSGFAAGPGKHHKRGFNVDKRVEKMTEHLELTDAQADKVRNILTNSKKDIVALKAQEGDRESKRDQFKLIRQSTHAEIDGVLTAEQLEKAEEFRANRKKHRKRKHLKRGKHRMKRMAKELDLTEEQRTKAKEIREEARTDIKKIVDEDFDGDRKAARSAVKARRQAMKADFEKLLTPDQAAKLAELEAKRAERKGKRGKRGRGAGKDKAE